MSYKEKIICDKCNNDCLYTREDIWNHPLGIVLKIPVYICVKCKSEYYVDDECSDEVKTLFKSVMEEKYRDSFELN